MYGGTKSEMERLIADASKMTEVQSELGITVAEGDMSFANIANAISVVQKNMGLMGTTAQEASGTISGSTGSMKAAWSNLVTGIADDNANFDVLVDNLVTSIVGKDGEGGFINNMLPRIQTALDGIVKMVVSLGETLLPQIVDIGTNLIINLVGSINENLPALLDSASLILDTLISGISSLLPSLLPVAVSLIETLVSSILENLPMIFEAGILMVVTLAQGVADMLPELIPLAINAVLNLVDTLISNIDLLIDAGIALVMGLAEGLLVALPQLIAKIPIIVEKLLIALISNAPKLLQMGLELAGSLAGGLLRAIPELISAGANMLAGLFKGLLDPTAIWNAVCSLFDGIVNGIKSLFGINSPSTVFRDTIGANLALGLGEGFSDTMGDVTADMQKAIPTEFDTNVSMNASSSYGSTYDHLVSSFKEALRDVKVVMNNREMGEFVVETVERVVYS